MTIPTHRAALERLLARLDQTIDKAGPVPAWMDSYCTAVQALKAEPEGEGPSLADVDELCAEFGFHLDGDRGESLDVLRDMITAAITRWRAPGVEPDGDRVQKLAAIIREVDPARLPRAWSHQFAQALLAHPGFSGCCDGPAAPPAPEPPIQPTGRSGLTWEAAINGLRDVLVDQTEDAIPRAWQRSRILTAMGLMAANSATSPAPEPGEIRELVKFLTPSREQAGAISLDAFVKLRRAASLLQQQATELAALREERFVAGQNRINQLWVDALDPSTQVPLSAPQIKKLRKVLDDHCDQGPPNGTMWKSQELEELMWAVEGWVSAATPPPAPQAGEGEEEVAKCETCHGLGTVDERLYGYSFSNPAATCPDCDGVGEPRRFHRSATPLPAPQAGEGEA